MHALGFDFGSAAQLSKRLGSVWNCLWGNALKRSLGIIRKSRVSYPGPGFLSSATWSSLPKKQYNGLKLDLGEFLLTEAAVRNPPQKPLITPVTRSDPTKQTESGQHIRDSIISGPRRPFHKSSYERFLLYEFVEPVLNYGSNEFVALTNLCETGPSFSKHLKSVFIVIC